MTSRQILAAMFATALSLSVVPAAMAHDRAHTAFVLSHNVTQETRDDAEQAADEFVDWLSQHRGQIVHMTLLIVPSNDPEQAPGYRADVLGATAEQDALTACADAGFGPIDNTTEVYEVVTKHPLNFHAPISIVVGDRLSFPLQEIVCPYGEADIGAERQPIQVSGKFSIQAVDIPTATIFRLTPAN